MLLYIEADYDVISHALCFHINVQKNTTLEDINGTILTFTH